MILIKDARSRTDITVSTAYRFWKMWNGNQKVPEKKNKKLVLKKMNWKWSAQFIVKLADNFVYMTLEQMRENLLEKYPNISSIQSTILLPYSRDVCFRFKETRKTYYLNSDEIPLTRKIAF